MDSYAALLVWGRTRLAQQENIGASPHESEILLKHVSGKSSAQLITAANIDVPPRWQEQFMTLIEQRVVGTPLAYITGSQAFWQQELWVDDRVLIPRPETEFLVEQALEILSAYQSPRMLELGTGSGCVAIAIADGCQHAKVVATDISQDALDVATRNADKYHLDIEFMLSDWYQRLAAAPTKSRFDLIVSNPPYIAADDPHLAQGDLRFEPNGALVSDHSGLADLSIIIEGSINHLKEGGWLMVEHGYQQGDAVKALFASAGLVAIEGVADYAGHDRVTLGRRRD